MTNRVRAAGPWTSARSKIGTRAPACRRPTTATPTPPVPPARAWTPPWANAYSVRWVGKLQPLFNETSTHRTTSDDGIRVWLDGVLIIDNWTNHAPTVNTATVSLTAGRKHDLKVVYFEATGGAVMKLEWESASQARQVVPAARLFGV